MTLLFFYLLYNFHIVHIIYSDWLDNPSTFATHTPYTQQQQGESYHVYPQERRGFGNIPGTLESGEHRFFNNQPQDQKNALFYGSPGFTGMGDVNLPTERAFSVYDNRILDALMPA